MHMTHSQLHRQQNGYTLIEILIAVVILSIGLLGMAGIQLKGMRGTQNAFLRTEAANLANSMAERMHANPYAAQNSDATLDNQYMSIDSSLVDCTSPPATLKVCERDYSGAADNCTVSDMATYDAFTWICGTSTSGGGLSGGVKNELPNGSATVKCIDNDDAAKGGTGGTDGDLCSPGSTHRITVSWTEANISADTDPTTDDEVVTQSISINTVP